jgi:hypothetical protein
MKLYKEGETSKAICSNCEQVRTTTFRERDVPLSSGNGIVRDVLVAVCDHCDRVVSLPQQSVPRVSDTINKARHPIEARIPRHLHDVMGLVCFELGGDAESVQLLFRFYLRRLSNRRVLVRHLAALASSDEAEGAASARFSAKLNDEMFRVWKTLGRTAGLKNADMVKGIIMQMKKDVLDEKKPEVRKALEEVLQLS